jgi:AraC-like DNA-binding protein
MQAFNPCAGDIHLEIRGFDLKDIELLFCGREKCLPGHSYGPDMRNHYVFHLILSGKGMFKSGGKLFPLSAGQGFLLFPETQVYYSADIEEPWEYIWVGFTGKSSGKVVGKTAMSPGLPVVSFGERFEAQRELLCSIVEAAWESSAESSMESYGLFLQFMSRLARDSALGGETASAAPERQSGQYVERAKEFIRENLSKDITASDVAGYLGLNRSYFCKIFTEACGKPPSRFIAWYRLSTAWHLLHYTHMPIAEISRHVGYNDPAYFSRCFAACYGQPPIEARSIGQRNAD